MSDDRKCESLQAADAGVFEILGALKLSLKEAQGRLGKQFNVLSENRKVSTIQYANRANLLRIVQTHKSGEPFRLDEIWISISRKTFAILCDHRIGRLLIVAEKHQPFSDQREMLPHTRRRAFKSFAHDSLRMRLKGAVMNG